MEAGIGSSRRPCFIEEDDGLTSLSDMEAGFSGNCQIGQRPPNQAMYSTRPLYYARRTSSSLKTVSCLVPSSNSPRSTRFYDAKSEDHHHQPHFLESCFGCKKQIGENRDIFMYRGDTPFCSEECRQDQIEIDEAKERNQNLASSMEAVRKKERKKSSSSSPTKPQNYPSRAGTVAAA